VSEDRPVIVDILLQQLDPALPLPEYEHPGDAGMDLRSRIDVELPPGSRALVPTGIAMALPDGYVALVHPRSGLALRHGITLVNAPGTVDAGYRGEIQVILINHGSEPVAIARGDRIAQIVFQQVARARVHVAETLPGSHRARGGFGSTGGVAATSRPEVGTVEGSTEGTAS